MCVTTWLYVEVNFTTNSVHDNNDAPLSATVKSTSHYKYRVRKEKCRHYTLRYGLRLGFNLISHHTVLPLGSDFL